MKRLPATFAYFGVLLAVSCNSAQGADPQPSKLVAITKVRIATQDCRSQSRRTGTTIEIEDSARVEVLVKEFQALRANSEGVWAAKYSCSTDVTFLQGAKVAAIVHVFPCNSLELAPVEGTRYFTYKEGLNRLSELAQVLGTQSKGQDCK